MTDEEFMHIESKVRDDIEQFKKACEEWGVDFKDRIDDIIIDALNN